MAFVPPIVKNTTLPPGATELPPGLSSVNEPPTVGNEFKIPDLSTEFPDLANIGPFNIVNKASDLTGNPVKGNKNGQIPRLNPNNLEKLAVQADTEGYNMSDADWAKRFPDLAKARDANILSAGENLTGQAEDPFLKTAMGQAGLGDLNFGGNEFQKAREQGQPILSRENRDRSYFTRLLGENPERGFGLNSKDVERIALANTNGINMTALGLAQGNEEQALANAQSSAQGNAALISSLGQLAGAGVKAYTAPTTSPTLSSNYYAPPAPAGYSFGSNGNGGTDNYSGNYYDSSGTYAGNTFLEGG